MELPPTNRTRVASTICVYTPEGRGLFAERMLAAGRNRTPPAALIGTAHFLKSAVGRGHGARLLCRISVVVAKPVKHFLVFFLTAEWRQVKEVVCVKEEVSAALITRIAVIDIARLDEEDA